MGWYTKQAEGRNGPYTAVRVGAIVRDCILAIVVLVATCAVGGPHYTVWQQHKKGEAELARAEQNRRIKVNEAEAHRDAAVMHAQAEVERAKGVAEANRIIADGLEGHDEYLRYLWIDRVASTANKEIIYVPTEAALPILEAGRTK